MTFLRCFNKQQTTNKPKEEKNYKTKKNFKGNKKNNKKQIK